jgi:pSer/pThr/pTyr-binding forkhead associated (FHA) protein
MRQIDAIRADGGTAFHDAVYAAVEQLRGASGRKVVIALTDGIDENSRRSVGQAITFAKDNHVPVYTIGLGRGGDIDTNRLRKLAQETDGEFHQTPTADQLAELYRKIAQELQNEYVISYTSPTPELDGTRREVVVNLEYVGGTLSTSGPYAVGGIIKSSINYPFFGALLLLLLVLLALPSVFRRIYARRPVPEVVEAVAAIPVSVVAPPVGPPPQPVTPTPPSRPAPARLVMSFLITKEDVSLGSAEGNDIVIPAPTTAPQHARISLESGRYVITDLSQGHTAVSFSGDTAQLRPSARNALKDGSLVKLGEAILVFHQPAQGSPWLEMIYEVTKPIVTVGSEAGNDIVLTHPSVSSRHAELRQEAGRWVVRDLDSAQGTFVSYSGDPAQERKVSVNALKNGSTVRFGQVAFVFRAE